MYSDLDVFDFDIFAFPLAQFLEGHQFAFFDVECDCLCIQHKGFCSVFDALRFNALAVHPMQTFVEAYSWQLLD